MASRASELWRRFVVLNRIAAREAWTGEMIRTAWRAGDRRYIILWLGSMVVLELAGSALLVATMVHWLR